MKKQLHDEAMYQLSLFTRGANPQDKETCIAENYAQDTNHPDKYHIALDRLMEALEDLLQGDYPVSDELRQRLSNPELEILIFEEMKRILKLE